MANVIAIVWDFDKTLVDGYMQNPIFEKYGVNSKEFWDEVNELPQKYMREQNVRVNEDTIYLNHFIHYTKEGKFAGLNCEELELLGKELKFYKGVPDIFERIKKLTDTDAYREFDIKVEHYIVSTGMASMIRGSSVEPFVEQIWGCEFIQKKNDDGEWVIDEVGYTIDNTSKTRALFEINKGVGMRDGVDVNSNVPEEYRRVHFKNMIYIADGPSDIPAFSVVNKHGGATFAIYPSGDREAMQQVEQMRKNGRINMYAEANYMENTTASMWIENKVIEFAERIRSEEKTKLSQVVSSSPRHLTD